MTGQRLSLALETGGFDLPDDGRVVVLYPTRASDLSPLEPVRDRVTVVTGFRPDHEHFERMGYSCATEVEGTFALAMVCATRAREKTRSAIAEAARAAPFVVVDGAKTDGIDGILRECRKRTEVNGPINKAHGKLFWFSGSDGFDDWSVGAAREVAPGYVTRPGVFSADGIDPASQALADALPATLGRQVADLGAGWGYLAARALAKDEGITALHLVEAEHAALDCARSNVQDPRAQFHWRDALTWQPPEKMDVVIMNPPFHTGRAADPSLGRAFIAAAAQCLKPSGQLWMVANRHLPYETALGQSFAEVRTLDGDGRFKLFHARRPSRQIR